MEQGRAGKRTISAAPHVSVAVVAGTRTTDGRTDAWSLTRSRVGSRKRRGAGRLRCMLSVSDVKMTNGVMDDGLLRYSEAE